MRRSSTTLLSVCSLFVTAAWGPVLWAQRAPFLPSVLATAEERQPEPGSPPEADPEALFVAEDPEPPEDPALKEQFEEWWQEKMREIFGGDFEMTFGAQIRVRHESRGPFNYATATSSRTEDFNLLRTMVHTDLSVTKNIGGYIQLRDSREFGGETGGATAGGLVVDEEGVDLHQGNIRFTDIEELFGLDFSDDVRNRTRVGRIRFPRLGDQRQFSDLDWSNITRAFDGAQVDIDSKRIDFTFVGAQLQEVSGVNGAGEDDDLYFVYFATTPTDMTELDLYAAWRNFKTDGVTGEDGLAGDLEDETYGLRAAFKYEGLRVTGEVAIQRGDFANDDVDAYAWAVDAKQTIEPLPWTPTLGVGWTFASGDGNPADGDNETFRPIAPFGHAYQGHYDIFAWQNGHDIYATSKLVPRPNVALHADLHHFILDESEDAWYDAAGRVQRIDPSGMSSHTIGTELDLYVKGSISKNLKIWTGWSHFWAGPYVDTEGGNDGDFLFFQMELLFGDRDDEAIYPN